MGITHLVFTGHEENDPRSCHIALGGGRAPQPTPCRSPWLLRISRTTPWKPSVPVADGRRGGRSAPTQVTGSSTWSDENELAQSETPGRERAPCRRHPGDGTEQQASHESSPALATPPPRPEPSAVASAKATAGDAGRSRSPRRGWPRAPAPRFSINGRRGFGKHAFQVNAQVSENTTHEEETLKSILN